MRKKSENVDGGCCRTARRELLQDYEVRVLSKQQAGGKVFSARDAFLELHGPMYAPTTVVTVLVSPYLSPRYRKCIDIILSKEILADNISCGLSNCQRTRFNMARCGSRSIYLSINSR